jgi:hypothetical protein
MIKPAAAAAHAVSGDGAVRGVLPGQRVRGPGDCEADGEGGHGDCRGGELPHRLPTHSCHPPPAEGPVK